MKHFAEFFEGLDETVYISDIENNELVYMNAKLRDSLGFSSHNDYLGKKCHMVLQGSNTPCSFCTNCKLKPGKFISWTHKNPILNQTFLVKDGMVISEGRSYRVEIAIDIDAENRGLESYYYSRTETILNGCLQQLFSTLNPELAVDRILAYIGETFSCDRCYIFEINKANTMSNTYEWCAEGITPQKELLQKEPLDSIDWWLKQFQKNEVIVIEDLEDIRTEHPISYALLKPQGISRLIAGPILEDKQLTGFIGVDNPNMHMMPLITPLINIIGYFLISQIRRRDLLSRLNNLSFHDSLTGAYNRNAMSEHYTNWLKKKSIGVVYCDITELKKTNDSLGHSAGDKIICHCYALIQKALHTDWIYRTGGDEFIAICPDSTEEAFLQLIQEFRICIKRDKHHIAVGYVWSDQHPLNLEVMISQADKFMYQDKHSYYAKKKLPTGVDHRTRLVLSEKFSENKQSLFHQFWTTSYHDVEALFQSITQENTSSYFYFGDIQQDVFYISDNMRDEFGFESNIVQGLFQLWAQHISTPNFQEIYWQDLKSMLEKARSVHDLRYQVRTASGKNIWIRCYGVLKWSEDKSTPLFFSGRITHQDNEFVVDPVTNFPRTSAIFNRLNELQKSGNQSLLIGFSLNNITEINNTGGRSYADRLLKNIGDKLMENLSGKMAFYRLDGMRCIALVDKTCTEHEDTLVDQIRTVIESCYYTMGISTHSPCSFAVMQYPYANFGPEDFIGHMISLIRVAKHETKKSYIDYSAVNIQHIQQMSKLSLALNQDVLNGMQNFRIVIQPVVDAKYGKIIGGEVLLRWVFEGKDISPEIFIPMLEKGEMIHLVGTWVFNETVRNCIRLITYIPDFYLTFNVSLRQLTDIHFTDVIQETLEKYHLSGSHLIAEMTESCLDEQPENLVHFVDMCNKIGMRIALDDFGSGYSSLRMLLRYPCNIIKLDRSLLEEIAESDKKLQFIRSIVYACHQFDKKVCIEGVENEEQNTLIQKTGCDIIQGFYYYRPMELTALYRLLSEM